MELPRQKVLIFTKLFFNVYLEEIGFEQQKLVTDGGNANYLIEVTDVSESGFKARATSVVDFDKDGDYNTWEIDQDKHLVEIVKD